MDVIVFQPALIIDAHFDKLIMRMRLGGLCSFFFVFLPAILTNTFQLNDFNPYSSASLHIYLQSISLYHYRFVLVVIRDPHFVEIK